MAMFLNPQFRNYARDNPVEVLFAVPYLVLVFSYNYPVFARSNFARFAIPTLPIVFVALARWMPPESQNSVGTGCGQANSCRGLRARHQKRAPPTPGIDSRHKGIESELAQLCHSAPELNHIAVPTHQCHLGHSNEQAVLDHAGDCTQL